VSGMNEQTFSVGDKVRVKDRPLLGDDIEEVNKLRGFVGKVILVDLSYKYPYTVQFTSPKVDKEIMFTYDELEAVK